MQNARIDVLLLTKRLRCTSDQLSRVVDNLADIVRDPSGGVRGVRAALEGNDFKLGSSPTGLRCRTHPRRIATDNHESFCSHKEFPSPQARCSSGRCETGRYCPPDVLRAAISC